MAEGTNNPSCSAVISRQAFNAYCATLPATTHVIQWGGADVWKVGDKVFAIGWFNDTTYASVTFKVSRLAYEVLRQQPGLRPAPYFASRGMAWIQQYALPGLGKAALRDHLKESHRLVSLKLTKARQRELNLNGCATHKKQG